MTPAASRPITPAEIALLPAPGCAAPGSFSFSRDDRHLAFLRPSTLSLLQDLWVMDTRTGLLTQVVTAADGWTAEEDLPPGQRFLRERTFERGLGVTGFSWAAAADVLLIPLPAGLCTAEGPDFRLRKVLDAAEGPFLGPVLSPDGAEVAFVRDREVWLAGTGTPAPPRRLTSGAIEGVSHGLAEFVAHSDLFRSAGLWWSPDGQALAFSEVDERPIPPYRIPRDGTSELQRYPLAGGPNANVRLGVLPVEGGRPVWMDLGTADRYLLGVAWTDAGLTAQTLSRDHGNLELLRLDPRTGARRTLHVERSDVWVRPHGDYRPLPPGTAADGPTFLWSSERTGWRHLEVRDEAGELVRSLTSGEWMVDGCAGMDHERGLVYFTGTRDGATESHLYAVPLLGGEVTRVTGPPGWHQVVVANGAGCFVDVHSSLERPPAAAVRELPGGEERHRIAVADDPRLEELVLAPPELVSLPARDGTVLDALVYRPAVTPAPGVLDVYGGPEVQRVTNSWEPTADLRPQALARAGYCVIKVDNRGTARRGLRFEAAIQGGLGQVEVSDQLDAVAWAEREGLLDGAPLAVYGWSYGGYMALRCSEAVPDRFGAVVAGAPVTSWDLYETFYTERYLGTPEDNPEGYAASSVLTGAGRIRAQLLVIHGLIDDNVHFRHTARLVQGLIDAGTDHDLLVLPEERHCVRALASRELIERRVMRFLTALAGRHPDRTR